MEFTGHRTTALVAAGIVSMAALGGAATLAATPGGSEASVFVPITPCRLFDTRPGPDAVGTRTDPLGPGETVLVDVTGTHGECTIPDDATAVALNATAVDASAPSFATFWPADAERPLSSNLNYVPGQAPTPNKIDVKLSPGGQLSVYNAFGDVHLLADVMGYYSAGPLEQLEASLSTKADAAAVYTKAQVDALLHGLTPEGSSGYTDAEIDALLAAKADAGSTYTDAQIDALLAGKADAGNTYTDAEIDALIDAMASEDEVGDAFEALGGAVYTRDEIDAMYDLVYTEDEIDAALSLLASDAEVEAMFEQRITLLAGFNAAGSKLVPGFYTSSKQVLGHFRVTFDVGLLDLPVARKFTVLATTRCNGTTVANTSRNVIAVGAYMDELELDFQIADVAGVATDCGVDVLVRFSAT